MLARKLRSAPLPAGMRQVLRLASEEEQATAEAVSVSARTATSLLSAARFYVLQVLLYPEADNYRVLGTTPDATRDELRANFTLLIKWLHPDFTSEQALNVYARRVLLAWNTLKTSQGRRDYDVALAAAGQSVFWCAPARGASRAAMRAAALAGARGAKLPAARRTRRRWIGAAAAIGTVVTAVATSVMLVPSQTESLGEAVDAIVADLLLPNESSGARGGKPGTGLSP